MGRARVFDHTGMTEIGAMSFECGPRRGEGVHVIESEFIPEVIDPETGKTLPAGEPGELVLTNLGRIGSPLIRYRTGDHVRLTRGTDAPAGGGSRGWRGGFSGGRMTCSSCAATMSSRRPSRRWSGGSRRSPSSGRSSGGTVLTQVALEIEPAAGNGAATGAAGVQNLLDRIGRAVQESLHFRCDVAAVPPGTLPRFEMKAKRFVRLNGDGAGQ